MAQLPEQDWEGMRQMDAFQPRLDFDSMVEPQDFAQGESLVLDLDGFEGPLHVLLELARSQKVDLMKISITRLAEQYLSFVTQARSRHFSLAADYLVMAAWLAYLKSRLLLPRSERKAGEETAPEDMAAALAFRLKKLERMREAVEALQMRPQLGRDVFRRGDPDAIKIVPSKTLDVSLYDLMSAYISQRLRTVEVHYDPGMRFEAFSLESARDHLRSCLEDLTHWTALDDIAPVQISGEGPSRQSCLASTLSASLELTKEGRLELQQLAAFETLYLRKQRPQKVSEAHHVA